MRAALGLLLLLTLSAGAQDRPGIAGVSHLAVYSADAAASERFYVHDLGATRGADPENAAGVRYWFNAMQFVEVLPLPAGYSGKSRMDHVAFQTPDAEALRRYLAAHGRAVPQALSVGADGSRWFAVADPEGNRVEFVQAGAPGPAAAGAISRHMIHVGYLVRDEPAVEAFYTELLGFRPYWRGGPTEDRKEWFSLQAPHGQDWVELMRPESPDGLSLQVTGILDHFALGVDNIEQTVNVLHAGGRLGPRASDPKIGRDGKWQVNLYDPDGTRAELMEWGPSVAPCCSPYLLPSPTGAYP
jgi:catechol 2,3-dioxygenase-like lactoylglutathione lyase family enzyme